MYAQTFVPSFQIPQSDSEIVNYRVTRNLELFSHTHFPQLPDDFIRLLVMESILSISRHGLDTPIYVIHYKTQIETTIKVYTYIVCFAVC